MVTTKKNCLHCHRAFFCRRNPNQSYCAAPACQNSRKRGWRKQKLAKDPDYRQNQRRANEEWRRRHVDYWRRYRETHPEYTDKNRLRQRARDQKRTNAAVEINTSHLAKSDAPPITEAAQLAVKSGFYQMIPLTRPDLAKCDALTVQLAVITEVLPELSSQAAILQRDRLIGGRGPP